MRELAGLDIRDLRFWLQEARRKMLMRRSEQAEASLLPNMKKETIRSKLNEIRHELTEIELGDKAEEIEELTEERKKYYENYKKELAKKRQK